MIKQIGKALLCAKSDRDLEQRVFTMIKWSVVPSLLSFELAVWYYYFYLNAAAEKALSNECLVHLCICVVLDFLIIWSHKEACKDPGFIDCLADSPKGPPNCTKCGVTKTPDIHHCQRCNKCVFLMDHHCWWTNNCLGYNTLKPFILFNVYVCILCLFGMWTIVH